MRRTPRNPFSLKGMRFRQASAWSREMRLARGIFPHLWGYSTESAERIPQPPRRRLPITPAVTEGISRMVSNGGCRMNERTIVLRKRGHWYVVNSRSGDEREALLTLLEHAENRRYEIGRDDVIELIRELGWELEVHDNLVA